MIFNPDIEQLPVEGLRKLQSDRLVTLVDRLNRTVPFYRHLWNTEGIDLNQIKNIEDLPLLPFTTKSDLRDHYPYGLFAVPLDQLSRIHASSGTTGKPTVVGYTKNDLNIFDEVVARSLVCAGARPGMKLHNAYGYGLFTGGLGMHGGATYLGMAVIPVSGGMTDRQVTILKDFQPEVICCTPSYALTLSEACKARGIDPKTLMAKYAVLGAEPWTETMRQQVESGLDVSATNIYGLSEIIGPGVSQECEEEKGTGSHIWEDHFFPEVVDPETGISLPYGEEGVLVLTTLTKEAFPLIRYWTNDICSIYYDNESKRTHIKMSPIKGRADDMLIVRGVNLYSTQVEEVLGNFQFLSGNYQIVVDRKGTLDRVKVSVELLEHQSEVLDQKELTYKIGLSLKQHLGLTIEVEISKHGSIPRSKGGKLNRILDNRVIR